MSRGLHLLGYDWAKGASAMTEALADGLSEGVTRQRAGGSDQKAAQTQSHPAALPPGLPPGTVVSDKDVPPNEGEGWPTRRSLWGLPNWQVAAGGVGAGAVLWRVLRGKWGI